MSNPKNALEKLTAFLDKLEAAKIWYRLEHFRDSICVEVTVPGERWEVEFFDDCHVELERFRSSGQIEDEQKLDSLLMQHIASEQ